MVTIHDVWKHVSNKIANKVNDPFEDLFAMIIPVDTDGTFLSQISSDCDEYEGDSYVLLRRLLRKTDLFPTGAFAYVCPAKISVVKDADEYAQVKAKAAAGEDPRRKVLMMSLVHPITINEETGLPSDIVMENGVYWLDTNTFEEMPKTINGMRDGEEDQGNLPMALGSLALKCAIDKGYLGELGEALARSLALAEQSLNEAERIFSSITKKNN